MFRRIANVFRGFFGLFISGFERRNPEALLEVEQETLRKQIASCNQGLAAHAGLCERLISQIHKLETDERQLHAETAANLRAGNRVLASQQALRLETVTRELTENRGQLEQSETTYRELIRARDVAVKGAQEKIAALKYGLDDLKIKRAMAELTEMASGMVSTIGGSGDNISRLHEVVEQERERAAGRARVARDSLMTSDLILKEHEQRALEDQALHDFATREGVELRRIQLENTVPASIDVNLIESQK